MCIRDYIRRKTTRVASQVSEVTNEQQQTLMPTVINENEPQYLPVREIGEKLDTDNLIRNIALTGPYGSGKSTVLYTLQQDYKKHTYLQISLATLESYDLLERDEKKKDKKDIEQLNRLIEYSILQQLIYREKYATVPNSRIKRIFHFDNWKLFGWTVGILLFFIAFLIAFEPSWLRVETMYRILDMGPVANSVADILSVLYMLFGISVCIRKILSAFCGYQLSRFNLKDGEVELKEASIFNKHLDEIIYFFQRTKYDVVIIEDLDRFNTSDIYLKLRELNQLINESKEIGRHIVFIYAVKDDVFKDEQRAKFFDYITTVIPIINPSNSKDKLKEALRLRGYEDIADDDLEEMAFFINDMRLLQNIANEYQQYRTRLCATGQITLNPTKLLGMIVYKNYFPKDFAQLHNREGDVYKCIAMKPKFIVYALQQLDEQKKQLEQKIKEYYHSAHIAKNDLREICAYQIIAEMPQKPQTIKIEQKYQSLKEVIKDEELFEQMISEDQIDYQYHHILYGTQPANFNIGHTGLKLDRIYWNRKRAIEELPQEIQCERKHIDDEERKIKSLRLHELLTSYDMGQCTDFTGIKLAPMLNVFLRQGYIDEDYYDYISYFYEGMITLSDYHLLLTMKQAIKSDYNAKIDKVGNFAKKIPLSTFNYDSVLNIQLADCLSVHNGEFHEKFELLMKRIERNNAPLDKIESGDVTIGNDQSEWIMPLAQITVGMDELQDGSADIRAIFDEVDIWLPTTLPGNAEWVDIVRLSSDGTYLDGMLEALIDEMLVPGSKKMDEVVDLIWSNEGYRERFTALIPADSEELFKAEFKKFFGEDNEAGEALRDTMGELAREFLSQIKINTITYNATLDVDDDLIDMLADNLDPEGTVDPVNTLDLYGEVRSSLPVSFEVAADFSETNVAIAPFLVEPDEENDIAPVRLYKDDIRSLFSFFELNVDFMPQKYYPRIGFSDSQSIRMMLHLKKRGGLNLNL